MTQAHRRCLHKASDAVRTLVFVPSVCLLWGRQSTQCVARFGESVPRALGHWRRFSGVPGWPWSVCTIRLCVVTLRVAPRVMEHTFVEAYLKKPTWCKLCNDFIWGLTTKVRSAHAAVPLSRA